MVLQQLEDNSVWSSGPRTPDSLEVGTGLCWVPLAALCPGEGRDVTSPERRPYFHVTSAGKKVAWLPFSSRISASCVFIVEECTQLLQLACVRLLGVRSQYSHCCDSFWQIGKYLSNRLFSLVSRVCWFCRT